MTEVFCWHNPTQSEFTPAPRMWMQKQSSARVQTLTKPRELVWRTRSRLTFCLSGAGSAGSCRRSSVLGALAPSDGLQEDRSCLNTEALVSGEVCSFPVLWCTHSRTHTPREPLWPHDTSSRSATLPVFLQHALQAPNANHGFCFGRCTTVIRVV